MGLFFLKRSEIRQGFFPKLMKNPQMVFISLCLLTSQMGETHDKRQTPQNSSLIKKRNIKVGQEGRGRVCLSWLCDKWRRLFWVILAYREL